MATNELMIKMEVLVEQMKALLAEHKKRSKTTKKDASAAPWPPLPAPSAAEMDAETDAETDAEEVVAAAAPKKPINAWINFTIRVNNVLNENDVKLPGAEQKQFCGALKDEALEKLKKDKMTAEDYAIISTEAILWARKVWSKPEDSKQYLAGKNKDKPASGSDSEGKSKSKSKSKVRGRPSKKIAAIIEEYGAAIAEDAKMGATV